MSTPNFTPYTEVLVILKTPGQADIDISGTWSTIEYEDALPQNVKITLNATGGRFLTTAPILQKYQKIFVRVTDARGGVLEDVFHIKKIKRSRSIGKNKQVTILCPHQSDTLWSRTVSLVGKRTSGFDAVNLLMDQINKPQNKGTLDPDVEVPAQDTVRKVGNFLDPDTSNNYIFEFVKLQTALEEISEVEQQPIEGGGSFEAVGIRFKSKYNHDAPSDADLNTVQVQAIPQGFQDNGGGQLTNIPNVTLIHQPLGSPVLPKTNILSYDSDEDPELATNLILVGDKTAGAYPIDWMQFHGAKDVFNNVRFWKSGQPYKFGNLVNQGGIVYECTADHTSSGGNQPPNASFWIARTFTKPAIWSAASVNYSVNDLVVRLNISWKCIQAHVSDASPDNGPPDTDFWTRIFFAPAVDYSPLTNGNTQLWVNALAGAPLAVDGSDNNQGRVCMVDPNVIIQDQFHPRTMVRQVIDNPANVLSKNKVAGVDIPDAYRVLAIDPNTGLPPVSGPWGPGLDDSNGLPFGGSILEFVSPTKDGVGEWIVFKTKIPNADQEVFEWETALPWVNLPCVPTFNLGIADRYVNNTGSCVFTVGGAPAGRSNKWEIGSYGLSEIPLVGQFGVFFLGRQMECAHSVKWDFTNHHIDMGTVKILDDDTAGDSGVFIKSEPTIVQGGKDFNPFYIGFNIHAMWPLTGQDDAAFAGPTPAPGTLAGSRITHPTFDFNNMFRDRFGIENIFGPTTEDFLPIQSFAFWLKFVLTRNAALDLVNLTEGDFALGIFLVDRRDNVRLIDDLVQQRKDDVLPQDGKLPGKPYKGVPGVSAFFAAQEPDTTDAFDAREFLFGGIYTRDSFDGQGRYLGVRSRFNTVTQMEMQMDGYRMIKPMVATNADIFLPSGKPTRNIGSQLIKKGSIVSYAQAKNLVLGLDKIFNFERRAFKENTSGRCDIKWFDSVYYTDSETINDTTDSLLNTIKGVNQKNVITLSKGKNGPGGFTSDYDLVTRLWP